MRERNALRQGLLLLAHLSLSSALSMSSSSSRSSSASSNQGWIGDAAGAGPTPALSLLSPNQRALAAMPHFPRTWVPLASTYELDGMRPNRVEFLGQSYVCYQNDPDDSSSWTVADDACPHRLAPLSEGRIIHADRDAHEVKPKERNEHKGEVTRLVECAYHGWAFDRNGRCVRIPQVTEQVQQRNIETNPKCHVHSYSTIVHKNLLFAWLWPEDSLQYTDMDPANQEHAWRRPEYMLSNLGNDTTTYTRDLPYGWDTLLENIVDPAHVPWAHHGLQGSRQDAIAINMSSPSSISERGLEYSYEDRTMGLMRSGLAHFRAPFVISYEALFQPKPGQTETIPFNLTTAMTPTKPGWSRIIIFGGAGARGTQVSNQDKDQASVKPKQKRPTRNLVFALFSILPQWVLHQFSNKFLDSDLSLLHFQERERLVKRKVDYDGYCIPAPADRCVSAMRRWILKYAHIPTMATVLGNKDTTMQPLLPPSPDTRIELFDRWTQHSDQCRHCHAAFDGIKKWRRNTFLVLAASVLMGKYLAARLVVVACLAVLRLLTTAENTITKGGFDHYKNA